MASQIDTHTKTFDVDLEPVTELSFTNNNTTRTFEINETTEPITKGRSPEPTQGKKKAFTHSSGWVGNVRYNPQNQTMRVMMNNKGYGFCGVPEKVYDSWEGSPSKGEYWWRNIKDQYDCGALQETEWNEKDHPRDDDGKFTGGYSTTSTVVKNPFDQSSIEFETGKPVTFPYLHNTQKSPNMGSRYGQDIEPHGMYITRDEMGWEPQAGYENGNITFNNPLVLQFEDTNQWKQELQNTTGKKGKPLSRFLAKKGYDGIVTVDAKGNTWEIVSLQHLHKTQESTNNAEDMDWPPPKLSQPDQVDCLMLNYSPDSGARPDGITPDEKEVQTQPYPTGQPYTYPDIQESACGKCKFYVDGGACAIVKGAIDPIKGICKFFEAGDTLPFNLQVFPIYEQVEAEYYVRPYEPYLHETINILDRKEQLQSDGVPDNEIDIVLHKEYGDTSIIETFPDDTNYVATGSKINSESSMHGEHGHQVTNPKVMDYKNENPDPDALLFDLPPIPIRAQESKLIRETIGELSTQFNWMTPDYLQKISDMSKSISGKFILVRASAEAITDHRSEGEPYRRLLKGTELAQLTRTGIGKTTDINHLGKDPSPQNPKGIDYRVDSDVLDAEYDPVRKETQMLVHLKDPEIIHYISTGQISTVSINAGMPRHMPTECDTGECFVVPRGLVLGELDGIAFTWVVDDPSGLTWRGHHIPPATPGVKTTKIELL